MDKVDVLAVWDKEVEVFRMTEALIGVGVPGRREAYAVHLAKLTEARAAVAELIEAADGVDATHGPMLNPRAVTPKQRQLALNRLRVALARVKAD